MDMFSSSRSYLLKFDRTIVPMAKGDRSRTVLDLAFDLAHEYSSEITALTVKENVREVTWSDKVAVVINAYKEGKEKNIKVIPKVRTSRSVKQGIVEEVSSRAYDLLLLGTFKRSVLSASIFGTIGDYVIKNSTIPTAVVSLHGSKYPYSKILVPLCETLTTRAAVSFALHMKKALNSQLILADLRKFDRKKTHGFNTLMDRLGEAIEQYGSDITVVRPGMSSNLTDEVSNLIREQNPDVIVMGVRDSPGGKVRFNSDMKAIIKGTYQDTIVVKK